MRERESLTIVKLGGSFAFSPHLMTWIEALSTCGGQVVVVPGGGPFADTVRAAQAEIGFDDRAAHHMALLAMEQFGCALVSLGEKFVLASSTDAIRRALFEDKVPVWSPTEMVLMAEDIPASWDVTSDSLALWLSGQLGAADVILVKQRGIAEAGTAGKKLTAAALVDRAFQQFLAALSARVSLAGANDHYAVVDAVRNGTTAGAPFGRVMV